MGLTTQQAARATGGGSGKVVCYEGDQEGCCGCEKNSIEHTKTERRILQGVDHPFMVKLRYALQNEAELYFVMVVYNGDTVHSQLQCISMKSTVNFTKGRLYWQLASAHVQYCVPRSQVQTCVGRSKFYRTYRFTFVHRTIL